MLTSEHDAALDIADSARTLEYVQVTPREKQILQEMSKGHSVKIIADLLHISHHTVIAHKKNLTEKFSARNATDLVVRAIKQNLISI